MSEEQRSEISKLPVGDHSHIRHTVAVMSGKGGVGKSSVAALLAAALAKAGHSVGVLDADITGPSIPKLFGVSGIPPVPSVGITPAVSRTGVRIMSLNLLLENEDDPVIWRGPLISGAVKQFWTDVVWGQLDFLIVDLPPGTGDAPLTVMQSLPLDGVVVVASPQDLAMMVVKKAINMARRLSVPIIGLVENMSFLSCPRCGNQMRVFGPSRAAEFCAASGIRFLGALPLDPVLSALGDRGGIEDYGADFLAVVAALLDGAGEKGAV